ncbi:MAG: hypothetical protein R3F14_07425 [Polyangiaceae bacterium]
MMKMKSLKLGSVALVLLAGCAGDGKETVDTGDAGGRRWSLGESFVYEVDSSRAVSMGDFQSHFHGELAVTVVGVEDDGAYQLRGDVREARYEQLPAEDLARDLEMPFFFTALPTGKIESFQFQRGIASGAASVQREMALSLQVVEPAESARAVPAWSTVEHDATGDYRASYSREGGAVHKVKVSYLPGPDAEGEAPIAGMDRFSLDSTAEYTLDASQWPSSVSEHESVETGAGAMEVTSSKTATLRLVRVEQRKALVGSMSTADLVGDALIDAQAYALAKVQADRGLVGGRTFAQIADLLSAEDSQVHNEAIAVLAALIRLDPGAAAAARAEMVSEGRDLPAKKRMAAALGAAGTAEAQRQLVSLLDPSLWPLRWLRRSACGPGADEGPTGETATALLGPWVKGLGDRSDGHPGGGVGGAVDDEPRGRRRGPRARCAREQARSGEDGRTEGAVLAGAATATGIRGRWRQSRPYTSRTRRSRCGRRPRTGFGSWSARRRIVR